MTFERHVERALATLPPDLARTLENLAILVEEENPEELEREIRITVLHEVAHYFGIDEDRLTELGYE